MEKDFCNGCNEKIDFDELRGVTAPWGAIDLCPNCYLIYLDQKNTKGMLKESEEEFVKTCKTEYKKWKN